MQSGTTGSGGLYPQDPARLRVSDEERHRVAEVLRQAAGEGRLDFDELDERLEATFGAKTYADLVPITADLPITADQPVAGGAQQPAQPPVQRRVPPPLAGPRYDGSFALMSETRRAGTWLVGPRHTAFALMGSVVLDLREVTFQAPEVVITANAVMGSVVILVNAYTQVSVEGLGIMGEFTESRPKVPAEIRAGAPVVRVRGVALMGSVSVKRRAMPGGARRGHRPLSD